MKLRFTKRDRKNLKIEHYPIEQAVLVPSTIHGDKRISIAQRKRRIREVKKYLSNKFGGFTSVSAEGGYYSDKKNRIIQEPVTVVTSFSKKSKYDKNVAELKRQLRRWGKKWKQETIGYSHEGDLYYIGGKITKKR